MADQPDAEILSEQRARYGGLAAAFSFPDFRTLWISTASNQIGQGMQLVLLGWLIFDLTDSPGLVGALFAVRSVPNLVVGFAAGSITDRMDRRMLMRLCAAGMAFLALLAAILLLSGWFGVWQLMLASFLFGILQAFYMTSRQVYVYDIVGSTGAINGIALIALAQRIGGIFGALSAGAAVALWGPGVSFLIMSGCFALGGLALYWLRLAGQSAPQFREPMWQNLKNYFTALKSNRVMLTLMLSTAASETLGFSHQVILPVLAKDVLHVGAGGLGILTAMTFVGGSLGVFVAAALGQVRRRGMLLLAFMALFGAGEVLLSQSSGFWLALLFIAFINIMSSATDILHHTLLQLSVPNEQRGRAMGSWIVGIGTGPAGQLEIGYLSAFSSVRIALLVNGLALSTVALVMGTLLPRLRRL